MTKEEAITILDKVNFYYFDYNYGAETDEVLGAIKIALDCIKHCIDEENDAEFTSPYTPEVKEHVICSRDRKKYPVTLKVNTITKHQSDFSDLSED